jgi:hypothetical protein
MVFGGNFLVGGENCGSKMVAKLVLLVAKMVAKCSKNRFFQANPSQSKPFQFIPNETRNST